MNFYQAKKNVRFQFRDKTKQSKIFFCIFLFWLIIWLFILGGWSNGEILDFEIQTLATISGKNSWSMFHNDLGNTGYSASLAPRTNETAWRFNTGGPVDSPTVSGDLVYIGSYDFDKTRAAGFILTEDDNYIKAEITDINKFRDSVYDIKVKKVATTDTIEVYSTTVSEDRIYHEKIIPGPGRLNVGDII